MNAAITPDTVAARLGAVHSRITAAGGDPSQVTVVAVTKGQPESAVAAAIGAGLYDLGENYAQELASRAEAAPSGVRWHFLGPVQRNKVKMLAPHVHLWHAVERPEAGAAIARAQPGASILVQVNVTGEPHKHGCGPEDVDALVERLRTIGLDVRGLMAVGPSGPADHARPGFRSLAAMASRLGLPELSMGMSHDLEVAVSEGATIVRVGTDLFGPRPQSRPARR